MFHYSVPKVYLPRPDRLYHNFRSRQRHTEADLNTVRSILAEYDLELIKSPSPGQEHHSYNLILHTSHGKKVLKKYNHTLARSFIMHEHSILTHLAQIDFPSPRLVAKNTGETLVHQDAHSYALFDFIEGGFHYHHYVLFPGQARQFITIAGDMLAILHDTLKDFVPQGCNPYGFKSHNEGRWRNLDWFLSRLAYCVEETPRLNAGASERQATWLLQRAKFLEESLVQLDAVLNEAALPRTIIHADYGPYNLLFRQGEPVVFLDFEWARLDWRVVDLVMGWYRFAYSTRFGFRLGHAKCLLDAYQTRLPLTPDEVRLMPAVWKFWQIQRCILNWRNYCETRAKVRLDRALWSLKMVDWMTANQNNLMANLNTTSSRL